MNFSDVLLYIILPALSLTLAGVFFRLLRGPSLPDRVVALDLLSTMAIAIIAVVSIVADLSVLLDVATVIALTGFLGTIAFAYYIERGGVRQ